MASVAENRTSETNAEASNSDIPDEKGQQPNGNNTNVSDAASEFPEGGRQAWLVVAGAWVSFFVSYGFISSAGVYQDYYQSTLLRDYSPSDISWIPSIQLFALSASAPFVGRIFDGHGPNVLVAVGTFLHIFGQMMQSLSTKYYQLLLSQAVCSGIGMGMMFHSSTASVATWFRLRRGLALGLASSGSGVGGVILPYVQALLRQLQYKDIKHMLTLPPVSCLRTSWARLVSRGPSGLSRSCCWPCSLSPSSLSALDCNTARSHSVS